MVPNPANCLSPTDGKAVLDRQLGKTEQNWCRAVDSGTGNTIIAILFKKPIDETNFQTALSHVVHCHPRLRSRIISKDGRFYFEVECSSIVNVEKIIVTKAVDETEEGTTKVKDKDDEFKDALQEFQENEISDMTATIDSQQSDALECQENWLEYVEEELNATWEYASALLFAKLYQWRSGKCLAVIRMHTCICDRNSAATVASDLLSALCALDSGSYPLKFTREWKDYIKQLKSVEEISNEKQKSKPFWAHGVDVIGYGLGSRRHACLHFHRPTEKRHSRLQRVHLDGSQTSSLLQACSGHGASLYSAIASAAFKASATAKSLEGRGEHFAVTTFVDCRSFQLADLSASDVGFYGSALQNCHHVSECTGFWDLAIRCDKSILHAIQHHKQFTDMGDLNMLMAQAIKHPGLTPMSSLRTSLLSAFHNTLHYNMKDMMRKLGVEDFVGCASVHGVGPCFAIFDSVQDGELHLAIVYPFPLFSNEQMQKIAGEIERLLLKSNDFEN